MHRCESLQKSPKEFLPLPLRPPQHPDGDVQAGPVQVRRLHPVHHGHDRQPRRHRAPRQAGMGGIMVSPQLNGTLPSFLEEEGMLRARFGSAVSD